MTDFDKGMLARLAENFERMPPEPPRSRPYWPIGLVVFVTALALVAVASTAVYPAPPSGPGWEICMTMGC